MPTEYVMTLTPTDYRWVTASEKGWDSDDMLWKGDADIDVLLAFEQRPPDNRPVRVIIHDECLRGITYLQSTEPNKANPPFGANLRVMNLYICSWIETDGS